MAPQITRLRRYTSLSPGIQILRNKALTLLSPKLWEDRNDSFGLETYKNKLCHGSLLALCFTEQFETFHHWKVFTPGIDGICFEFDKRKLLENIAAFSGLIHGQVKYREIKSLTTACPPKIEQLPFLKRWPYRDEAEYRLIYCSPETGITFWDMPIYFDCIRSISLSPWMPKSFSDSIKSTLRSMDGCQNLRISRSTLLENKTWITALNGCD